MAEHAMGGDSSAYARRRRWFLVHVVVSRSHACETTFTYNALRGPQGVTRAFSSLCSVRGLRWWHADGVVFYHAVASHFPYLPPFAQRHTRGPRRPFLLSLTFSFSLHELSRLLWPAGCGVALDLVDVCLRRRVRTRTRFPPTGGCAALRAALHEPTLRKVLYTHCLNLEHSQALTPTSWETWRRRILEEGRN